MHRLAQYDANSPQKTIHTFSTLPRAAQPIRSLSQLARHVVPKRTDSRIPFKRFSNVTSLWNKTPLSNRSAFSRQRTLGKHTATAFLLRCDFRIQNPESPTVRLNSIGPRTSSVASKTTVFSFLKCMVIGNKTKMFVVELKLK